MVETGRPESVCTLTSTAGSNPAPSEWASTSDFFCNMKIIKDKIFIAELKEMSTNKFGNLVKAVVDIEREIMAVDADLHADEEAALLEDGSSQRNLWGINIYPELAGKDFVEFDSLINLRPSQGNRSRGVDDQEVQKKILEIVNKLVEK